MRSATVVMTVANPSRNSSALRRLGSGGNTVTGGWGCCRHDTVRQVLPGSEGGGGSAVAVGDGGAVTVVGVSGAGPGSGPRGYCWPGLLGSVGVSGAGLGDSGGRRAAREVVAAAVGVGRGGVRVGHVGNTELRASSSI